MGLGLEVESVRVVSVPKFANKEYLYLNSPVLIKRQDFEAKKRNVYTLYDSAKTGELLLETLKGKMKAANVEYDIQLDFDKNYSKAKVKKLKYKGIVNYCSMCPLLVKGEKKGNRIFMESWSR